VLGERYPGTASSTPGGPDDKPAALQFDHRGEHALRRDPGPAAQITQRQIGLAMKMSQRPEGPAREPGYLERVIHLPSHPLTGPRQQLSGPGAEGPDATADFPGQVAMLSMLHRMQGLFLAAVVVPSSSIATAVAMDVLTDIRLIVSLALTVGAGALLAWRIVPDQSAVLAALDGPAESRLAVLTRARQLSMTTGIFALLWSIVVVLMIVRPGSTTSV
jgi:hypothetical protein